MSRCQIVQCSPGSEPLIARSPPKANRSRSRATLRGPTSFHKTRTPHASTAFLVCSETLTGRQRLSPGQKERQDAGWIRSHKTLLACLSLFSPSYLSEATPSFSTFGLRIASRSNLPEVEEHCRGVSCVFDTAHDMNMDGGHAPPEAGPSSETVRGGSKSEPAPAPQRVSDAKVTKPKRSVVHVACACCRRLRIKVRIAFFWPKGYIDR